MTVVKDREFLHLMKAGRPGTSIPTPATVSHDVKISFAKSHERIDSILKVGFTVKFYATDYLLI